MLGKVRQWWAGKPHEEAAPTHIAVNTGRRRSLTGRRRTVRAELPCHYFTDGDKAVSVTGTYGKEGQERNPGSCLLHGAV